VRNCLEKVRFDLDRKALSQSHHLQPKAYLNIKIDAYAISSENRSLASKTQAFHGNQINHPEFDTYLKKYEAEDERKS
jgi:hypothetical protein